MNLSVENAFKEPTWATQNEAAVGAAIRAAHGVKGGAAVSAAARVRACLSEWTTAHIVATELGLDTQLVSATISTMFRKGWIEKRPAGGRRKEYRLKRK